MQKKQKLILSQLLRVNKNNVNKKIHSELSQLGWHLLHCIFIEAIWVRSYFFSDDTIVNKFKNETKIKKPYIEGEFEDIEEDDERKL